ncbi:MAG: phosphotransferase [Nocardioides sp.]
MTAPRAVGVHLPYEEVPARVRAWVDHALGSPVVSWDEQVGGMSPGCVTRVVAADGVRAFVKAVGAELNPDTPGLFRREIAALTLLGPGPLWADLHTSYDDGDWVALMLEDVEGRHPDLADDGEMAHLLAATDRLGERLVGVPLPDRRAADMFGPGYVDLRAGFVRWRAAVDQLEALPADLVPEALRRQGDRCRALADLLLAPFPERLVHWDVRVDNLIRRPDGTIVFVDWGTTALGPAWADPLLARLERVESSWFDTSLGSSAALAAAGDDLVTGWLVAFGSVLAWRSTQHTADVGLPTLNEFRRTEARRMLAAAARRLG